MSSPNNFSRRQFLKAVGLTAAAAPFITSRLFAQSAQPMLRHASFGVGGMGWSDLTQFSSHPQFQLVAMCDVDTHRSEAARKKFPQARFYQDWRELLDKEAGNIDSVNVATPDHMHAPIAVSAMRLGKHVYGQKPLAHDLYEVRRMTEIAAEKKLVTQMGIQIHSAAAYRVAVRILQDGAIGKIKEVHSWCFKSWGDTEPLPQRQDPVPTTLDWDLWLGVCAKRPFIGNGYYHPENWRKRLDFGTGTFGDMGCHIFDPVFKALELTAPTSVRSEGVAPDEWNWALNSTIHYQFPGTRYTAESVLPVTWYDGDARPPADVIALLEGDKAPMTGSIFVGTAGTLLLPHISKPVLYPDAKFQNYEYPNLTEVDHWGSFIDACLGKGQTSAHFGYSGPLTEAVLLGGVASRFPHTTLDWNSARLRFDNRKANHYVRRTYRRGWRVKGLS